MSACPKIVFEPEDLPVEAPPASQRATSPWWYGAIHLVALLSFLGLCALLGVVGLLWFSLRLDAG
jgi:hypothetical protein